jgi:hypothetical protein
MLTSINPLGERGRHQKYGITVTAYVTGSTIAGAFVGALLGAIGAPFDSTTAWIGAIVLVAILGLLLDTRVFGWRVPGIRRQVNEDWLTTYRGWVYGAGFGAQLGGAFTTIVSASITYVAFACALASGWAGGGAIVGGTFGLFRAMPVLVGRRATTPTALRSLLRRVEAGRPRVARATLAVQVLAIVVLVAVLV